MTILDPEQPYRYLEMRGRVVAIDDDPEKRLIDELARKYRGLDEYADKNPDADRVIIRVEPEKVNTLG